MDNEPVNKLSQILGKRLFKDDQHDKFRQLVLKYGNQDIDITWNISDEMKDKSGISKRRLQQIFQGNTNTPLSAKEAKNLLAYFAEKDKESGGDGNLTINDIAED